MRLLLQHGGGLVPLYIHERGLDSLGPGHDDSDAAAQHAARAQAARMMHHGFGEGGGPARQAVGGSYTARVSTVSDVAMRNDIGVGKVKGGRFSLAPRMLVDAKEDATPRSVVSTRVPERPTPAPKVQQGRYMLLAIALTFTSLVAHPQAVMFSPSPRFPKTRGAGTSTAPAFLSRAYNGVARGCKLATQAAKPPTTPRRDYIKVCDSCNCCIQSAVCLTPRCCAD